MNSFDTALQQELAEIQNQGLRRELRRVQSPQGVRIHANGKWLLNFSSNDYLGLANAPELKSAAQKALADFGAGSGASRLLCGSLAPHHELEETLAAFKGTEAALSFSSGYATALGTLGALVGKEDLLIVDKLVHACIVDAARLSGARLRVFKHNDLNSLEKLLQWASSKGRSNAPSPRRPRILIATESVFSMDGDLAPLPEIIELKDRYGAWLMLDEAHATGLFGGQRRGVAEASGLAHRVEIQMGTLGKALGAAGGYICGSRSLIDLLVNRARSFIFSTAPPPATAAAATAGIRYVQSPNGEARCATLWSHLKQVESALALSQPSAGWICRSASPRPPSRSSRISGNKLPDDLEILDLCQSPIVPLMIGDEIRAVEMAAALFHQGLFIPAIRYPAVARKQARLRLTITAAHSEDDLRILCDSLNSLNNA